MNVALSLGLRGGLGPHNERTCASTGHSVEVEAVGFDGERLLQLEGVRWIFHSEVESLEDGGKGDDGFLPGKGAALVHLVIKWSTTRWTGSILTMQAREPFPNGDQAFG